MMLSFIQTLTEAGRAGAIPHPEETALVSSSAALQSFKELTDVIQKPESITIKWDGSIALVFGRLENGKLSIMDKYMYDRKSADGTPNPYFAQSPADWQKWDEAKASGKLRGNIYEDLTAMWDPLDATVGSSTGFFWGDLMWSSPTNPLQIDAEQKLTFGKNKVNYKVPVKSPLGQKCVGRVAGIAVHQYASSFASGFTQWNGQGLESTDQITILSPTEGKQEGFSLSSPVKQIKIAKAALAPANCKLIDDTLNGIREPASIIMALTKYLNTVAKGQTHQTVYEWLQANISGKQYAALVGENQDGYLVQHATGWQAIQNAFLALNNLKNAMANELESQIPPELEQYIGGQRSGEGFVFNSPEGLRKIVNKGVFTAAQSAYKR